VEDQTDRNTVSPVVGVVVLVIVSVVGAFIVHLGRSVSDAPSSTRQVAPLAPDADGVVRCATPAESAVAAGYTLAALLKRAPVDPAAFEKAMGKEPDFLAAGRLLGLETSAVQIAHPGTLKEIHPMILSLRGEPEIIETVKSLEKRLGKGAASTALQARSQTRYAVLTGARDGDAVLLDPLAGRVVVPVSDLFERVEGRGFVWLPPITP
jgi:hypothetical protein